MKKLLCIVRFDSNLKASLNIANLFEKYGYAVSYFLLLPDYMIDKGHHEEIGFNRPYTNGPIEKIINSEALLRSDVVLLDCDGNSIYKFNIEFNRLFEQRSFKKRPVLIAGYHGITYERRSEGYFYRSGVDVFYLNSKYDFDDFKYIAQTTNHCSPSNLYLTGLPFLDQSYVEKKHPAFPYENILFAAQPTVPESFRQRFYLISRFIDFARKNPDKTIFFKPRHKPKQFTLQTEKYSFERILKKIEKSEKIPENFVLTYSSIIDLIKESDLVLTISSTAAFEAYNMGKTVGFIVDFDIKEESGSFYFIGSGCQISFRELFESKRINENPEWWAQKFLCDGNNTQRLFKAADKLVEFQDSGNHLPLREIAKFEFRKEYDETRFNNSVPIRRKITDFLLSFYYQLKKWGIVE